MLALQTAQRLGHARFRGPKAGCEGKTAGRVLMTETAHRLLRRADDGDARDCPTP